MNERQKLQQLFQFDYWCTRKLTELFAEQRPFREQEACAAFVSHIINTQKIWFSRVVRIPIEEELNSWEEFEISELKSEAKSSVQMWIDLIADHDVDLDTRILYSNSKGMEYRNTIRQISNHIIVHGEHHRAQISIFLKNCDINPPSIDYIDYVNMDGVQKMLT